MGIINSYSFDGTGSVPTVQHDGFENGSLPDASLARLHYNEIGNQFTDEDEITEIKADFEYVPDKGPVDRINFGAYRQEREKSSFQIFGSQCQFCGYGTEAPLDEIDFEAYSASNYFPGLIDTFYSYDGDKMLDYLADQGFPVEPTLQNNRYTINEDITSLYMDFTIGFDLADMPVTVNMGARYSETDIEVAAVQSFISDVIPTSDATLFQNVFGPATDIQEGTSYSNLLPSFNVKLELQDNMILRFAAYDSITRPTMSQLSPATTFNEPRRQNLTASGGNPALKPSCCAATNYGDCFYCFIHNGLLFEYFIDNRLDNKCPFGHLFKLVSFCAN